MQTHLKKRVEIFIEAPLLRHVMTHTRGNQSKAARMLGLTPRQIGYAIKQLDIEMQHI